MITIGICDDDKIITSKIENMLLQIGKIKGIEIDIKVFFDGYALEKTFLLGTQYDLIYLEIMINKINGIEIAKNIRKMDQDVLIIYVSGYENRLKELFEVEPFRFISKPIDTNIFGKYFMKAYERICSYASYYEFQYKRVISRVLIRDIIYFESNGRTINIILANGKKERFNAKLNDVENDLQICRIDFIRIHQSYLINYRYVQKMAKTLVKMANNEVLPISKDKQKEIKTRYCMLSSVHH